MTDKTATPELIVQVGDPVTTNWADTAEERLNRLKKEIDALQYAAMMQDFTETESSRLVCAADDPKLDRLKTEYAWRTTDFTRGEISECLTRLRKTRHRFQAVHGQGNYGAFRLAAAMLRNACASLEHVSVILEGPLDESRDPFPNALISFDDDSDGLPF